MISRVLQQRLQRMDCRQEEYQGKRGILKCGFRADENQDERGKQIRKPDSQVLKRLAPFAVKFCPLHFVRFVFVGICGGQRKEPERDCPKRIEIEVDRKVVDFHCKGQLLHKAAEEEAKTEQQGPLRVEPALLRSPDDGENACEKRKVDYAHIRMEKHLEKSHRRIENQGRNDEMIQETADGKDGYEDIHDYGSGTQFPDLAHIADKRAAAGISVHQIKEIANRRRLHRHPEPILVIRPKEIAEEI